MPKVSRGRLGVIAELPIMGLCKWLLKVVQRACALCVGVSGEDTERQMMCESSSP